MSPAKAVGGLAQLWFFPRDHPGRRLGVPSFRKPVKSRDILYILSLHILYIGEDELGLGIQRSMIFERWIPGSSSRIRVVQ